MDNKIIRPCINCGSNDFKPMFTYTYNFMSKVRRVPADYLREIGWTEDITSTIVKCNECGGNYVRDVFPNWGRQNRTPTPDKINKNYTYKRFRSHDEENWLARNLIFLATQRQRRDIKFLDFGAGSGDLSNAARVWGVKDVVAYDPYSGYGHNEYKRFNFPGIIFTRNKEDVYKLAPFDVVACQGMIEHTIDPRGELKAIYECMPKGGYLYISNPLMNIDKEKRTLSKAKLIRKKDRISHYHPGHLNYLTPRQFTRILLDAGFKITAMIFCPPTPIKFSLIKNYLIRDIKFAIMKTLYAFGLPYKRYLFVARKP